MTVWKLPQCVGELEGVGFAGAKPECIPQCAHHHKFKMAATRTKFNEPWPKPFQSVARQIRVCIRNFTGIGPVVPDLWWIQENLTRSADLHIGISEAERYPYQQNSPRLYWSLMWNGVDMLYSFGVRRETNSGERRRRRRRRTLLNTYMHPGDA